MDPIILPYNEELIRSEGAFIKPNGEIEYLYLGHEYFASDYCEGDEYNPSKLSKEELKLFKLWLKLNDYRDGMYADFLVHILGWDKLETVMKQCFTTPSDQPYTRFYNYYLMNWNIIATARKKYAENIQEFIWDEKQQSFSRFSKDQYVKDEIIQLKKEVPLKDRHLFFK